ncbi:MAG: hypothetical protein HW421_1317 [Ignavibacteria bacterium]|nr:hypothetical protein [Ignavibacteria bacterium]
MLENEEQSQNFWEELCGTNAFISLGLKEINNESLSIFDKWYMEYYPFLYKYLMLNEINNKDVLEIGLGFGTVGEQLALHSNSYIGLDYSINPVKMMNQRFVWKNITHKAKAIQGDAKSLPFDDNIFDFIVSIGCLHHTGNTKKAIEEVYRVLKPAGKAMIMLYSKGKIRNNIIEPLFYFVVKTIKKPKTYSALKFNNLSEFKRALKDSDSDGNVAPITETFSKNEVKEIFSNFSKVSINKENLQDINIPFINKFINRKKLLNNIAKKIGIDLYICASK